MTSIIKVDNIQNSSGTAAISIDSNGQVSMPNTVEIDQWRLTSDFATDASTLTPFERVDDASFSKVGTGMSESSGVFTFPKTGLYKIISLVEIHTGNDNIAAVEIEVSSDSGSSYDRVGYLSVGGASADADRLGACSSVTLVNVTNASTFRFRLLSNSISGTAVIKGNTSYNRTSILFERITDSQ